MLALVLGLTLLAIANGGAYAFQAQGFVERVRSVDQRAHLDELRRLSAWNRWAARTQLVFMLGAFGLAMWGFNTGRFGGLGMLVFIGINGLIYFEGRWIKGLDQKIHNLPAAPALVDEYRAIVADMKRGARITK